MYEKVKRKLTQKFLPWIRRVAQFLVVTSCGLARSCKKPNSDIEKNHSTEPCSSGGYNDAFIFENWASYGPRH